MTNIRYEHNIGGVPKKVTFRVVKAMVRTIKWTARTAITLSFCLYIRLLIERSDNCEFIGYSFDHKDFKANGIDRIETVELTKLMEFIE